MKLLGGLQSNLTGVFIRTGHWDIQTQQGARAQRDGPVKKQLETSHLQATESPENAALRAHGSGTPASIRKREETNLVLCTTPAAVGCYGRLSILINRQCDKGEVGWVR